MSASDLEGLRRWFRAEARSYPWTETEDPYAIWISEVMLQQTVVTAAVGPFSTWMARWPTLEALAKADEQEVLRAWEGLGYASRARNLHRAAQLLCEQGKKTLPNDEASLRALPGVGEYTAAAVLSFAFHQPALTLDANLKRVFQRLEAEAGWTPAVDGRWRALWSVLVDGAVSRESNQAVMQLGQRVCRARNPLCGVCPLAERCRARAEDSTDRIPRPQERITVEKATAVVVWTQSAERSAGEGGGLRVWLARPVKGRFSNLWLFPPFEGLAPESLGPNASALSGRIHTYTKYRDRLSPWTATWSGPPDPPVPPGWTGRWASADEAQALGMVSVYRKIWDEVLDGGLLL